MKSLIIFITALSLGFSSHLEEGNRLYAEGDFKSAIISYREAVRAGENLPFVHYNMGNAYYQIDSLPQAVVQYRQAIASAPQFFRPYINLGILLVELEEYAEAASIFERASLLNPRDKQLRLSLGVVYMNLRAFDLAVPLLQQVYEEDQNQHDIPLMLYKISLDIGDREEARSWLSLYPDTAPRATEKYLILSEMAEEDGDFYEVLHNLRRAESLSPENRWIRFRMVHIYEHLKRSFSAILLAEEYLEKNPDFPELAVLAGNIAFNEKMFDRAEKLYTMAYSSGHALGVAGLANLSKVYQEQGLVGDATRVNNLLKKSSPR